MEKQKIRKFFDPDFLRTFLARTPGGQKCPPINGAARKTHFSVRMSTIFVRHDLLSGPKRAWNASAATSPSRTGRTNFQRHEADVEKWSLGSWPNRRRTNVQQLTCKMVWSFSFYSLLFSFILFYSLFVSFCLFLSLWTKTVAKPLNSKKKSWRRNSEKLWQKCENVWKSVKKCEEVPRRFCPLVVAL